MLTRMRLSDYPRTVLAIATLTIGLGLPALMTASEPFRNCQNEYYENQPANQRDKNPLYFFRSFPGCAGEFLDDNEGAVVGVETLIVCIFTVILGVGTLYLWRSTQRLAEGADETAQRQLRAYLSATPDYIGAFNALSYAAGRYTIFNHGQTPAYKLTISARVDILNYPLTGLHDLPPLTGNPSSESTLHKDQFTWGFVRADRLFSSNETEEAIIGRTRRFHIYGIIQYDDIFQKRRTTKFCRSIIGRADDLRAIASGTDREFSGINYEISRYHNEAD